MTTSLATPIQLFAHRGFSSRQPEMTLAAYSAAIDWARATGVRLGLECDVQFTADKHIVCLHDLVLGRTTDAVGPVAAWRLADLRALDFGSWQVQQPTESQRSLVTLEELLQLVQAGRQRGADVELTIETKHPQPGGLALEREVCRLLTDYGWHLPGAPVRLITFSVPAAELLARMLPETPRSLLVDRNLGRWSDGILPDGITVVGVDITLLRRQADFIARARSHGNEVHAWTVNSFDDIAWCRELGVTGITSDYPDRVLAVLSQAGAPAALATSAA